MVSKEDLKNTKKGDEVKVVLKIKERIISKGSKIEIFESELYEIVLTLGRFLSTKLLEKVQEKLAI